MLLFLTFKAHSQSAAEKKLYKKIAELKKQGVDTLLSHTAYYGIITRTDTASCFVRNDWFYLIWLHDGHNYVQLFDECYNYSVLEDQMPELQQTFSNGLKKIMTDNILPPTVKDMVNGKEKLSEITSSDGSWFGYTFYLKEEVAVKNFYEFSLTTPEFDGKENIYHQQNMQTTFKKLHDSLQNTWRKLKFTKI